MSGSWLNDEQLEKSTIVANCQMNRERVAVGSNGYDHELRFDLLAVLEEAISERGHVAWLDICCGRGYAMLDVSEHFRDRPEGSLTLHGVDLVDMFAEQDPSNPHRVVFYPDSINTWSSTIEYDLITCVHGLHYIGDKIGLICRMASWLTQQGRMLANFHANCLYDKNGNSLASPFRNWLLQHGIQYDARRKRLDCQGRTQLELPASYLGADDQAGPNYTGQAAVNSHYDW